MKTEAMSTYYVRWRHIPPYMAFTPLMMIPIDHTVVEAKKGADEWYIAVAISKKFELLDIYPDQVSIDSFQDMETI